MKQSDLFAPPLPVMDRTASAQGKADGMTAVAEHATTAFASAALTTTWYVALARDEFTSDDIWRALPEDVTTHDYRALGPVLRTAQRRGWIVPTDRFQLTEQRSRHRAPIRIWRSRLR